MTEKIEPKFKIGQVVKLKSGGINMTVEKLIYGTDNNNPYSLVDIFTGDIRCSYFEEGKLKTYDFPQDMLQLVSEN
ncbi:MAG: DUF2158 domain-containing protein [Segetibacter sp.]